MEEDEDTRRKKGQFPQALAHLQALKEWEITSQIAKDMFT